MLKHHADELNDWPTPDTKAHLEKHLTGESLNGQDVVLWYAAHFLHDETHEHKMAGGHVVGPTLKCGVPTGTPRGQLVALASSPAMDSSVDSARSGQGFPAHNATNSIISQILSLRATGYAPSRFRALVKQNPNDLISQINPKSPNSAKFANFRTYYDSRRQPI